MCWLFVDVSTKGLQGQAALHASDRPAKQQLGPNKMQFKSLPTMCLTKTNYTMISLCTCYILCLQLPLNTTMY